MTSQSPTGVRRTSWVDVPCDWWFIPVNDNISRLIRTFVGILVSLYFVDSLSDAWFWFSESGTLSSTRIANFLEAAELSDQVTYAISPLFLVSKGWVYSLYCILGIGLGLTLAFARSNSALLCCAAWLAWIWLVGWANRLLWLAGMAELTLSLALFATAIATLPTSWRGPSVGTRLFIVQGLIVAFFSWISMITSEVWTSGNATYWLAASTSHPALPLDTLMATPWIAKTTTFAILGSFPIGGLLIIFAVCRYGTSPKNNPTEPSRKERNDARLQQIGVAILLIWPVLIAMIGSHWIHGGVLAVMLYSVTAILPPPTTNHMPD